MEPGRHVVARGQPSSLALFSLSEKDIFDLLQNEENLLEGLRLHRPDMGNFSRRGSLLRGSSPLPTLIHVIVSETGGVCSLRQENPQAVFNIDKLLDTAREFDRRGYTTLQDFVEWVGTYDRPSSVKPRRT